MLLTYEIAQPNPTSGQGDRVWAGENQPVFCEKWEGKLILKVRQGKRNSWWVIGVLEEINLHFISTHPNYPKTTYTYTQVSNQESRREVSGVLNEMSHTGSCPPSPPAAASPISKPGSPAPATAKHKFR